MRIFKIITPLLIPLFLSCNNSDKEKDLLKKENDLLRKELELEKKENDINNSGISEKNADHYKIKQIKTDIEEVNKLMNSGLTILEIDTYGNIKYDSGTASNGRFKGNLKNVELSLKLSKDIPEKERIGSPSEGILAVIILNCKDNKKCLEDMGFNSQGSVISFVDQGLGMKVFELLNNIQKNL